LEQLIGSEKITFKGKKDLRVRRFYLIRTLRKAAVRSEVFPMFPKVCSKK
jgi:hypothetical protein